MRRTSNRTGLILLVVLGMLSLFSLLAVTYVAFSGAARTSSLQMARRDFRGTPPDRLLDQAIRQVIRGTTDVDSSLWRHSLLEDYYGSSETPVTVSARSTLFDEVAARVAVPNYTYPTFPTLQGQPMGPQLFGGTFLKIPLQWDAGLPIHHDAWTGRVITFLGGPLQNQSFRIMRYVGKLEPTELPRYETVQFTVLIDLSTKNDRLVTVNGRTRSVSDWTSVEEANGAALLYSQYAANGQLTGPYSMIINGGVQNGTGVGVYVDNTQTPPEVFERTSQLLPARAGATPVSATQLKGPYSDVTNPGRIRENFLPNRRHTNLANRYGTTYAPNGDDDEPYDAPDFNDFWLAWRRPNATSSDYITPSFHRPEIINYLASLGPSDLNLYALTQLPDGPEIFLSFLELVQRATARPLSYKIENFPNPATLASNTHFSGSNSITLTNGLRNPQLQFNWAQISNNLPNPAQEAFDAWLRWQLRGPWDVDNDGDGIMDSVWTDLNFPLITSPEGKLLKALAAIYIEDMDGKLDINASGSQLQATAAFGQQLNDYRFAYLGPPAATPAAKDWPQGLGLGAGDINLRHLFQNDSDLQRVLDYRYSSTNIQESINRAKNPNPPYLYRPGVDNSDDTVSRVVSHQSGSANAMQRGLHSHARLPGLPKSTHGRIGIALDLLGNPILMDGQQVSETEDDPYESFVLRPGHFDRMIAVSQWERIARFADIDRSTLPKEAESLFGANWKLNATNGAAVLERIHSISPRNVTTTLPRFARTYKYRQGASGPVLNRRVGSFIEFVEEYLQRRFPTATSYPIASNAVLRTLFPLEFQQNRPLDLNRPLGNGVDDALQITQSAPAVPGLNHPVNGDVDEPLELITAQNGNIYGEAEEYVATTTAKSNLSRGRTEFDPTYDPLSSQASTLTPQDFFFHSGNRSRQLLARHLYCLAQLLLPVDSNGNNLYIFPNQPTNEPVKNTVRARILAQWAVNVVDFRDSDAAMTRFPYDEQPFAFNGTNVVFSWDPSKDKTNVVFGFEQPELLITESLATHDIRVKQKSATPLEHYQMRLPEGSLFLEFMCPRSTAHPEASGRNTRLLPGLPSPLYVQTTGGYGLNLNATTTDGTNVFPVWRVLITEPTIDPATDRPKVDPFTEAYNSPDSFYYSYQLGNDDAGLKWQPRFFDPPPATPPTKDPQGGDIVAAPKIDRILWFANLQPTASNVAAPTVTDAEKKVYYYRGGNTILEGGQYLVVGPRPVTYFGSKIEPTSVTAHHPSNQRIELLWKDPDQAVADKWEWAQVWGRDNNPGMWLQNTTPYKASTMPAPVPPPLAAKISPCITLVAGANLPDNWTGQTGFVAADYQSYIGLNVSEPTPNAYYPLPTDRVDSNDATGDPINGAPGYQNMPKDGYVDLSSTNVGATEVFDKDSTPYFLNRFKWPVYSTSAGQQYPKPMTQKNWSAAVLQRLADPGRPFHAVLNPYITVDWHSIDLTVFSGHERADAPATQDEMFVASRAKSGDMKTDVLGVTDPVNYGETFYSYENTFPATGTADDSSVTTDYFKQTIWPEVYAVAPNAPGNPVPTADPKQDRLGTGDYLCTLGYLNRRVVIRDDPTLNGQYSHSDYLGVPSQIPAAPYFPNRDFVSPFELANVPLSGPATFQQDFFIDDRTTGLPVGDPQRIYRHVMDFDTALRRAKVASDPAAATPPLQVDPALAEIWDLVGVRSPWPDAWKVQNPEDFKAKTGTQVTDFTFNELFGAHEAPMNMIPTYTEPGRVNLNTVPLPSPAAASAGPSNVLLGLMGNLMPYADRSKSASVTVPYQTELIRSLQTVSGSFTPSSILNARDGNGHPFLDATIPTQVPGVFTSTSFGKLFPLPNLVRNNPIDTTLFRRAADGKANTRLFSPITSGFASFTDYQGGAIKNTFLHNYPAARLANMTTDRSNVFAVRITLGFFEYTPGSGLGLEYGSEQGRTKRHRAFYLIDRSIPVGFTQGKDLNTSDTILSRRIIE